MRTLGTVLLMLILGVACAQAAPPPRVVVWDMVTAIVAVSPYDPGTPDGAWLATLDLPSDAVGIQLVLTETDWSPAQDVGVVATLVGMAPQRAPDGHLTITVRVADTTPEPDNGSAHAYILAAWFQHAADIAPRHQVKRWDGVSGHWRAVNVGRGRVEDRWFWFDPAVIRSKLGWPAGAPLEFE